MEEENIRQLLSQFCIITKSKLTTFTFTQDYDFICEFRTAYDEKDEKSPSEFCDRIINEFGDVTSTNWIVRYSFPNAQRLKYRKVYVCQHSAHNKIVTRKRNDTRIRDKNCKAQIDIKIKVTTRNSIRKDSMLKEGLNTIIKVSIIGIPAIIVLKRSGYSGVTRHFAPPRIFFGAPIPHIKSFF